MTGSYELRDLDHALVGSLYEGKLVIDKTHGHAAYGCGACCGYYGTELTPNPFSAPPGINNSDVILATEECGGYVDDVTDGGYNWHSSNTAVATLPNPTLHTVAAGSATGNATIQLQGDKPPSCPGLTYYPTQPVTVQQPTDSRIVTTLSNYAMNSGTAPACPSGQAGWYRRVQKIVTDQNTPPGDIIVDGATISETLGLTGTNQLNLSQPTAFIPVQTAGGGYFDDQFGFCSPLCPGSTGQTDITEVFTDKPPTGGSYTLRTHTLKYTCTGNTDNGQ